MGAKGARLIADLRDRAFDADYSQLFYRDPIRPGIIWLQVLIEGGEYEIPVRGKLDESLRVCARVFPKFLDEIENLDSDEAVMQQIPPISVSQEISGLELVTALEYIVFLYPEMVRAWASLVFAYSEILGLHEAASRVREECLCLCSNTQVVFHLLGEQRLEF
jgi:hypothetical protein